MLFCISLALQFACFIAMGKLCDAPVERIPKKKISTRLLTVLINSVIVAIEQSKHDAKPHRRCAR